MELSEEQTFSFLAYIAKLADNGYSTVTWYNLRHFDELGTINPQDLLDNLEKQGFLSKDSEGGLPKFSLTDTGNEFLANHAK